MTEPAWLARARRYLGVAEIKGPQHNRDIIELLDRADGKDDGKPLQGIRDDETPWCATFVSAVLEIEGVTSTRSAWARSYSKWGVPLGGPAVGAIAVLERGKTSGHVAFVAGRDAKDNLMLVGGNQGDMVKISAFNPQRVIAYRWPAGEPLPTDTKFLKLPRLESSGRLSVNEA